MKMSYLYGIRARDWWRLLVENRFRLSPRYLHRASLITLLSCGNSWMHSRDRRIDLGDVQVWAPIFIVGHWRSGTTHLQYLLSQDPRLASPNTYEVCFPNSFLRFEETHGKLLARYVPTTRPQDRMTLGMNAPNEDEIALAALGLPSPYLYLAFPRQEAHYRRFLTFRDTSPGERERFKRGLDRYLRKLTWKHQRTLLLKSPTHTARVGLLLEMYPDARFIHIHRNPYAVFRSTRHLHETWFEHFGCIQRLDRSETDERILALYRSMYDAFFEEAPGIPEGQYHEVRFEDLESDPVGELRKLYASLSLPGFPEQRLRRYLETLGDYRKNDYAPLSPSTRRRVARRWARNFGAWGYPTGVVEPHRPGRMPRVR